MKKIMTLVALLTLVMSFTACGRYDRSALENTNVEERRTDRYETVDDNDDDTYADYDDYEEYEGGLGDKMQTAFFDFTVNSAYTCKDYNGYLPADGKILMVADVTVTNTMDETIPMYDTDFQAQWNDDAEDAFAYPITLDMETGDFVEAGYASDEQLPYEYELEEGETREGTLVYEVPEGMRDFSISSLELFSDGSEGNVYFVYFTAKSNDIL